MIFHWPQYVYCIIAGVSIAASALTDTKSAFIGSLIGFGAMGALLYAGGFFSGGVCS